MAAGDLNDPLSNIPNLVLVDQSAATAAPGAGYGRVEVVNGVLGVRVGTGAWVPLASLVAGLLTALTEKVTPADTDLVLLQDEADSSALKKVQVSNLPGGAPAGGGLYDALVILADEKAQNTAGGTFSSGAWRTRDLNTERADTANIASVASNQVTLPAGTYRCTIWAPAWVVGDHQARLQNITGAATLIVGTCSKSETTATYGNVTHSMICGTFTLGVESALEIQHRCVVTRNTDGFGPPLNWTTEVYTLAVFERLAA